jgi:hypothetical protein
MEIELLYDVFQEEIPIPIAPYGDDIENQQIKVKKKTYVQNGYLEALNIHEHGIEVIPNVKTGLKTEDFYNMGNSLDKETTLRKIYYNEICTIVKNHLKCDFVCPIPNTHFGNGSVHTVRNLQYALDKYKNAQITGEKYDIYDGGISAPLLGGIHTDYASTAAFDLENQMVNNIYPSGKEDISRFVLINAWRNISHFPIKQDNLALLQPKYVNMDKDLVEVALTFKNISVRQYHLNYLNHDKHKWTYFPDITKDELLIFKQWDTDKQYPPFVFHTAFKDQTFKDKTYPARESIEVRIGCFWNINKNKSVNSSSSGSSNSKL